VFSNIPERMVYPSSEIGINNAGYRAAIQFLGGNELNTPLKMNKSYTPVDWNNLKNLKYRDNVGKTNDIKFNIEFALFYGISQKEFIDRGLVEGKGKDYEIIGTLPPALP
jgi:hypothetical protein